MSGFIRPSLVGPRLEKDATNEAGPKSELTVAPTAMIFLQLAGAPMVEMAQTHAYLHCYQQTTPGAAKNYGSKLETNDFLITS
jgi:hypothetical protein